MRGLRAVVRVLLVFLVAVEARLVLALTGGASEAGFVFLDLPVADASSVPRPDPVMAAVATLLN